MQPSPQAANAWRVLFLLFLANLFNFFDRTIPAIIIEPVRHEWSLSDFQLGLIGSTDFHSGVSSTEEDNFAGALGRIHAVLDPEQRNRLAELLESGPRFGGPYRGWV